MAKVLMTSKQVAAGFDISTMALLNWRKGQVGKKPLPAVVKQNGAASSVRFDVEVVKKWAAKHGLDFSTAKAEKADAEHKRGPVKKAATAIKQVTKKPAKTAAKPATKAAAPKGTPLAKKAADKGGTPVKPKADVVQLPTKPKKDAIVPPKSQPTGVAVAVP